MDKLIYLHNIPQTAFADKELLSKMLENCIEAKVLGLTIDIFLDGNQFIRWAENLINGKLSADEETLKTYANNFIKDNPDFLNVELEMDFFNEHLKKLKEIQAVEQLIRKDNLSAGFSIEELDKLKETREKSYALKLETSTNHYDSAEKLEHIKNILPFVYEDFKDFKEMYFSNKYNQLLENTSAEEKTDTEQLGSYVVEYNKNHWNKNCYDLFMYLMGNYEMAGKIKYINVWYFLRRDADKKLYTFNLKQKNYKEFIRANYSIEIKKFSKAEFDYDVQKGIMNAHEDDFRRLKTN